MRVEIQLERSVQPIVHEDVRSTVPGDSNVCQIVKFHDGTWIGYPYRHISWIKVSDDDND